MNISLNLNDIKKYNVSFLEPKKNVIMNGSFTKINFLNELLTMNGIYIYIPIIHYTFDSHDTKDYIKFNFKDNNLSEFFIFESNILDYYNECHNCTKNKKLLLTTQLQNGYMKYYKNNVKLNTSDVFFTLKISGVWESDIHIGLTYKLLLTKDGVK